MKSKLLLEILSITLFTGAMFFSPFTLFAQVKVGDSPTTINAGSVLELESTNKGLLMPRISLINTTTWGLLGTPAAGMHVYNTNLAITSTNISYPILVAKIGEYYWDGAGWVALAPKSKSTSLTTFAQTTPGITINFPTTVSATCGAGIGSFPAACATNLNRDANFTIANATNDVTIDITGIYSVSFNTSQLTFYVVLCIDKTTPGTFEIVDNYFFTHTGLGCSAQYLNLKTSLKNLPARAYNVRVYFIPRTNAGAAAVIGFGKQSNAGSCGNDDFSNQKVVVAVSE